MMNKLFLVMVSTSVLWAANPEDQCLFHVDESMVVTAQFAPERARDSVYPVSVLDQTRIQQSAAVNLDELLRFESGLVLDQHPVFGSAPKFHGISGENIKILLDGVPVVGRLNGIIDLDQLNLSGIERVEMVEGPATIYYGSDALAGVINLVPVQATRPGLNFKMLMRYDDTGDRVLAPSVQWRNGIHGLSLDLGHKSFDGKDLDPSNRSREWHERNQNQIGVRYNLYLDGSSFSYDGRFFDETLWETANAINGSATDTEYQTTRNTHQLRYTRELGDNHRLETSLAYADYQRDLNKVKVLVDTDTRTNVPGSLDRTTFDQVQFRGVLSSSQLWRQVDYQLGFEGQREGSGGDRLDINRKDMEEQALFFNLRYEPIEGLILQPSIRIADHNVYTVPVIPALHLLNKHEKIGETRAWYSQGFRGPSSKQLYLDFTMNTGPYTYHIVGNDLLEPEESQHGGLSHSWRRQSGSNSFRLTGELFYNQIDHLIALGTLEPVPGQQGLFTRSYLNVNRHRTNGGELGCEWVRKGFSAEWGLTYTRSYDLLSETQPIPDYSKSLDSDLRLGLDGGRFHWNLLYRYNGERLGYYLPRGSNQARATRIEPWNMLDVSVNRNFFQDRLGVQFGVRNLLDIDNLESIDQSAQTAHATNLVSPGRSFFLSLRLAGGR